MAKPTKEEMDFFLRACLTKGWTLRVITHPKSRENWKKPIKK